MIPRPRIRGWTRAVLWTPAVDGIAAPSAPIVLSVSDDAVIDWQLYLAPA